MTEPRAGIIVFTLALAAAAGGCDRSPTSPPTGPASPGTGGVPWLQDLTVEGPASIALGQTGRYTARAHYSNSVSKDVTADAVWTPPESASSPVRFTTAGVASAQQSGENLVTAAYQGRSASIRVLALPLGTFKLSGTVAESGAGALSGVTVEVISGTGEGLRTTTQRQGQYALYGVGGQVVLRASAPGFNLQLREVVVRDNDATEEFSLLPSELPADVSGMWTMSLSSSPRCRAGLPEIAKGRTYQVELTQQRTQLTMKISAPTVQVLNSSHSGSVLGSLVRLSIVGDTDYGEWSTPDFWDHLSASERLGFSGLAIGELKGTEIRAAMHGDLVYWKTGNAPTFEPTWYCRATDHELILRR